MLAIPNIGGSQECIGLQRRRPMILVGVLEQAFTELGYSDCATDDAVETSFEKVALYGSGAFYTHVARQLPNGKWTSKLGRDVDIEHDSPDDVAGGIYGEVVQVMKRPIEA